MESERRQQSEDEIDEYYTELQREVDDIMKYTFNE